VQPNLLRKEPESASLRVEVVTQSLVPYGLEPGTICFVEIVEPGGPSIEVWELDGHLHARHLRPTGRGWYQAYTRFLSAGEICYSLGPDQMERVVRRGWIRLEPSA